MMSLNIVFADKEKVELVEQQVEPLAPDEILCRADVSLVSTGTETVCLSGKFDPGTNWERWVKYPFYPGYGMSGTVLEIGKDVQGIKAGDRVAVPHPHHQYFKTKLCSLTFIPDSMTSEEATWKSLACTTQLGVRRANLALGESVGIIGMGMLGQLVVQYLSLFGVGKIVCIDTIPERLAIARKNGATHTVVADAAQSRNEVSELTGGKMLDVIFDVTGHPAVLAPATELVRKLGRVVLLGDCPTPSRQVLGPNVVSKSLSILGIHGTMLPQVANEFNSWTATEMTSLFFQYISQGKMKVSDMVSHRYSPLEAPQVYRSLLDNRSSVMGVLFDWSRI